MRDFKGLSKLDEVMEKIVRLKSESSPLASIIVSEQQSWVNELILWNFQEEKADDLMTESANFEQLQTER